MSYPTTEPSKRVRRFLPEPIETTTRKSKAPQPTSYVGRKLLHEQEDLNTAAGAKDDTKCHSTHPVASAKPLIHIKPPCSTASHVHDNLPPTCLPSNSYPERRHRGEKHATESLAPLRQSRISGKQNEALCNTDNSQLRPRKFVPQLMETASRSFRRDSCTYAPHEKYRPEPETDLKHASAIGDTPVHSEGHLAHESRFSYFRLRQRQEIRRHSFRVPDLPVIPSSGSEASEASDLPSLPVSPSVSSRQSVIRPRVEEGRRESCDELFSSYLLSLAARSTEKQLRDQALAAFPNEQVYQPVDHFAIDTEEDCSSQEEPLIRESDELRRYRRASSADLSWELEYMRQHKEEAEMRDRAMAGTQGLHLSCVGPLKLTACGKPRPHIYPDKNREGDHGRDQQKHLKSPPMLGDDLTFPQSLSPETTFCESHPLAECSNSVHNLPHLWHAAPHNNDDCGGDGLWMGTCKQDKHCRTSQDSLSYSTLAPVSRIRGTSWAWPNEMLTLKDKAHPKPQTKPEPHDEKKRDSSDSDTEPQFQDGFVTQIYNYLSLGYPCVAHAKGYVSIVENPRTGTSVSDVCSRWLALRSYIRDWASQQATSAEDNSSHGTWGVRERRGSWAG
ncbi:hypothetical protein BDV32DRAFT_143009 [Aspergillus pseudonomiae]|uniref:Uncharacterized protein n=1 Tax=Aspergillus pseudonomiae TaxID=1506151 RepID=A0A5N7CVK9_9EURO|nr:uncharacterized protein BDV37DRAFT_276764 [Aspergillus pseudonomiae]KAB8254286.1 hypothetical protein BDV32DRAFT_143009 [Aspergillus pseudonomiae]KAE8397623.1 hypothetical protein BDV37DRAFT_276764 [Aspergillus pseudonomiae]